MTNEKLFGCDRKVLFAAWNEYRKIVGDFIDKNPKNDHGGFARVPLCNPFTWLWKTCDTALLPEFEPGKLVVDSAGHYGIVVERTPGQIYDHEYRLNCVLVDFRGTAGRVIMDADKLKPAEFPPELIEFAVSGKKDGLKEKVHEKVEEAFNA